MEGKTSEWWNFRGVKHPGGENVRGVKHPEGETSGRWNIWGMKRSGGETSGGKTYGSRRGESSERWILRGGENIFFKGVNRPGMNAKMGETSANLSN